jgi:hypothetical protein
VLVITHAHDDHITGIGDLYDRYQVVELWLPQHAKKLQQVAGNYADFERVVDEQPEEQKPVVKGSRSVFRTFGDDDEVSVRCFSPPGYIDPTEDLDEVSHHLPTRHHASATQKVAKTLSGQDTGSAELNVTPQVGAAPRTSSRANIISTRLTGSSATKRVPWLAHRRRTI